MALQVQDRLPPRAEGSSKVSAELKRMILALMLAGINGPDIMSEAGGCALAVEHAMMATQRMINAAWRGMCSIQQHCTRRLNLMQMNLNSSLSLGHKTRIKLSEKWTVHI